MSTEPKAIYLEGDSDTTGFCFLSGEKVYVEGIGWGQIVTRGKTKYLVDMAPDSPDIIDVVIAPRSMVKREKL